jgi:hypothetical protein
MPGLPASPSIPANHLIMYIHTNAYTNRKVPQWLKGVLRLNSDSLHKYRTPRHYQNGVTYSVKAAQQASMFIELMLYSCSPFTNCSCQYKRQ